MRIGQSFRVLVAVMTLAGVFVVPNASYASAPQYPGEPLVIGDTGAAVATWQSALGVAVDSDFGPATQQATAAWQSQHNLTPHGWVGEHSWNVMFGLSTTSTEVVFEGSGWGHGVGMTQFGAKGMADQGAQHSEILSQFYTGSTVKSIEEVLGAGHWLNAADNPIWVNVLLNTDGVTVTPSAGTLTFCQDVADDLETMEQGHEGPLVHVLQLRLIALGYLSEAADGDFGSSTTAAVEAFQTAEGIGIDGRVGLQTRDSLWPPDEAGEQCVVEIPFTTQQVFTRLGDVCTFSASPAGLGTPVEAECDASIRGVDLAELTPANHVELPLLSGREYSDGFLRLRVGSGDEGHLHAIHQVGVEMYVAGISEVPSTWPAEALQAQAVAARSYGVYPLRLSSSSLNSNCSCHHYSSNSSQVYVGYNRVLNEDWADAVAVTQGQVMHHPGAGTSGLVQTFYSSSSGGATQNSEDVFSSPRPYLVSVQDLWSTNPATGNSNWRWVYSFSPEQAASRLGVEELVAIVVTDRFESGAVKTVSVSYTQDDGPLEIQTFTGPQVTSAFGLKGRYYDVAWPSPAGVDGFVDTFGSVHRDNIERLAELGITYGCNPPTNSMFCPSAKVTRGQMAAFLTRAFDLAPATLDYFSDDDGSIFQNDINRLAQAGITNGCGDDMFCPDQVLSREQMAAFLVRALGLPAFQGEDRFIDDDQSIFEDEIERLAEAGITLGCNPPANDQFCPTAIVSREQMASFLVRAVATQASS